MKKNVFKYRLNIQVIICLLFVSYTKTPLYAQIVNDSTEVYLEIAKNLFNEKEYSSVITVTDKGLALYNNKGKDMMYVILLQYKYLAYNRIGNNRSAMPISKDAIITYCNIKGDNDLPCNMSKDFVELYTRSGWEDFSDSVFVMCLHNIFRQNCLSNDTSYWDNLRYYKYYNEALTGWFSHKVNLDTEYKIASEYNNPMLTEYVNYARGYREINGLYGRGTSSKKKYQGIGILEQTEGRLIKMDNLIAKYLLNDVDYQIANVAEDLGEYELAAIYFRKMIELDHIHWKTWKYKHPWANPHIGGQIGDKGIEPYCILDEYLEALKKANMNADLVNYCEQLLSDSLFEEIDYPQWYRVKVLLFERDAYKALGEETKAERIDSILNDNYSSSKNEYKKKKELDANSVIVLYDNSQLSKNLIDSITSPYFVSHNAFDYDVLYQYLIERDDYETLISIASSVYQYLSDSATTFRERIFDEEEFVHNNWNKDYERMEGLRTTWHHWNGDNKAWITCHYLALAYFCTNDIKNAISFQKEAVDIVKLDWDYYLDKREDKIRSYSYFIEDEPHTISRYLDVEQKMYGWLAYFYLQSKDYENAYECYRKKNKVIIEIIEGQITYGTNSIKYKTWERWSRYIYDTYSIIDYTEAYPPFGDLILECNSLIKGFMLNIHTETYNAVKASTSSVSGIYTRREQLEKVLEESYYNNGNESLSLSEQIGKLNIELNNTIDFLDIVRHAGQNMSAVESNLDDGDVLVDIFALYDDNIDNIEKTFGKPFDSIVDGQTVQFIRFRSFPNPTFYATIVRKGWGHPKVIKLGNIASVSIDDAGRDLLDCVYHQLDYDRDINRLYRSTTFGNLIWGKIIEIGNIKKGENIYFCPTSYLNDVAVEYLSVGTDGIMSERYNMYRLSTIRELNKPESVFKKGDRCVAFGDIVYSTNNKAKKGSVIEPGKVIDMASSPEAIFNREKLDDLESTKGILKTVSRQIPKARVISGKEATEESFFYLSGNSPELLVIATHGYNYEREELNKDYENYLYGNRDNTLLSEQDRSMYKSGLYMAPSPNNIPTNGMLTAKEISLCNFRQTKLAIVAACVSALGNNTDEGVFGIQRGLKMAGVQSMLVSLWNVDAEATRLLIEEFVRQYVKGVSPHEALRMAQQHVRDYEDIDLIGDKHKFNSPYNWAGFILID